MKKPNRAVFHCLQGMILILLSLLLASCKISAPAGSETTQPAADAIFTAAAQTAEYRRIERITQTAAQAPIKPTVETPAEMPSQPPSETPVETPTQTLDLPSPPSTVAIPSTDVAVTPVEDKAEFIEDVNVPDGTQFPPGKHFQKTWRIENTGKTTWTAEYAMVFIDGDLLGANSVVALPKEVPPWEKVNVSIDMVAPSSPGKYTSYWKLRNASGKLFGFGEAGDEAIWVQINVESGLASDEDTLGQTITSTITGTQTISAVSLSVDNPEISGCPHTFLITALIDLSEAAMVTYRLEGGDNTGTPLRLPFPTTRNLNAGAHPVIYELTFTQSITGWARLRITQPELLISDNINFSLNCG